MKSYYNYIIKYRPGSINVRADCLSRRPDYTPTDDEELETILDPKRCSFFSFLNITDFNPLMKSIKTNYRIPLIIRSIKH